MKLVLAEKPSVAQNIAKVLGANNLYFLCRLWYTTLVCPAESPKLFQGVLISVT